MIGLKRWAGRVLVVAILLWGVLAVFARLATPLLEHYREPLARWLSGQMGTPVHIGLMRTSWYGIGPRLRLNQVSLGEGRDALQLGQIDLELSPGGLFNGRLADDLRESPLLVLEQARRREPLRLLQASAQREQGDGMEVVSDPEVDRHVPAQALPS